jgi:hypothetical protein
MNVKYESLMHANRVFSSTIDPNREIVNKKTAVAKTHFLLPLSFIYAEQSIHSFTTPTWKIIPVIWFGVRILVSLKDSYHFKTGIAQA